MVWSIEDKYFIKNKKNITTYLKTKISNLLNTNKIYLGNIKSYRLKVSLKEFYYNFRFKCSKIYFIAIFFAVIIDCIIRESPNNMMNADG